MTALHIAQVNIARMKGQLDDPVKTYVYRTAHAELIKQRADWFHRFEGAQVALWWVPGGHLPSVDEAKTRLAHLAEHGPSQMAFTFRSVHPPDESFLSSFDWSVFKPCPAV